MASPFKTIATSRLSPGQRTRFIYGDHHTLGSDASLYLAQHSGFRCNIWSRCDEYGLDLFAENHVTVPVVFLADYFVKPASIAAKRPNALKRLIYSGRVANYQAKSEDGMQAVADVSVACSPMQVDGFDLRSCFVNIRIRHRREPAYWL
ncbi:MAG: hypothetical protein M3O41_16510 [Pseudomonadota bacterium]|nr:hypothetical protein [Pseudomonadota bacterium]